jgi:hypothetical protein
LGVDPECHVAALRRKLIHWRDSAIVVEDDDRIKKLDSKLAPVRLCLPRVRLELTPLTLNSVHTVHCFQPPLQFRKALKHAAMMWRVGKICGRFVAKSAAKPYSSTINGTNVPGETLVSLRINLLVLVLLALYDNPGSTPGRGTQGKNP